MAASAGGPPGPGTTEKRRAGTIEPSSPAVKTSAPEPGPPAGPAPDDRTGDHRGRPPGPRGPGGRGGRAGLLRLRHRVPHRAHLRARSGADSDRLGRAGWRWSTRSRSTPPRWPRVFGGPGVAVAHAASQDLDVLMAACGAIPATVFDTQIVAGFLGLSTPSLSRLVDQMLGVSLPKADRLSDWLVRPISERQITYALNDVAYLLELRDVLTEQLRALGRLEWALSECEQVLGDRDGRPRPRRGVVEARATSGACRGAPAPWRRRWRRGASARPPRPTGPGAWCCRTLGLLAMSQRPPRNADELRATRGVDGRHLAQGRASRHHAGRRARPGPPAGPDPDARGGTRRAGSARPPSPCARASSARSPTTSISTRASWPRGPTSPNSSAASRAGSIRGGGAPSSGTRCAG